jgi:hypothetical protein
VRWEPLDERVQRQLRNALALLRGQGEGGGAEPLAAAVRDVARAREHGGDELQAALVRLADTALRWDRALAYGATEPGE